MAYPAPSIKTEIVAVVDEPEYEPVRQLIVVLVDALTSHTEPPILTVNRLVSSLKLKLCKIMKNTKIPFAEHAVYEK
jgi:hypothetical protein